MRLRHKSPFRSVLPEAQHDMAQPACLWQQLCRGAAGRCCSVRVYPVRRVRSLHRRYTVQSFLQLYRGTTGGTNQNGLDQFLVRIAPSA